MDIPNCPLCQSNAQWFHAFKDRTFYQCTNCRSVFVSPDDLPEDRKEMNRYAAHHNDVHDPGYQSFVTPIVKFIRNHYPTTTYGLDYGAGPGPVITTLLTDEGYTLFTYDPFFAPYKKLLTKKYHYIICSEVMEHFHHPHEEFALLHELLLPGGHLVCMTDLYKDDINFEDWYYKNDFTHVFFYHIKALKYIQKTFHYKDLEVTGRLIVFKK